ncbi:hypothetical protein HLB23_25865 [Nocardia uniformis]|uniref:Outer membrane channel protein CpnT-like N-terminal domain-containing protein n=1 Tax=Nocardia uniformis TaxID=53432 RepID=A0A849C3D4_9NOCA|nr:hypothetical protein [Nocardia uniformis]NNH73243.1 hypothetical protein [Nocardia uniformis]
MAIEIPHEVALFLNVMGVPYPDIDEDQVRELARQVRDFAANVANTHESATGAIDRMGSVYSGYSYEQLVAAWARMSATHMADLDRACQVTAQVLDAAANVITIVKAAVLAGLAALAASYASLMAATIATAGLSAAMTVAIRAAAARLVTAMEQTLLVYLAAEVIGKAIEPLEDTVARMINGVAYEAAADALGVPPPPNSSALPLHIEPDEVMRYAQVLDDHADDIVGHAGRFADTVAALDFTTASGIYDAVPPSNENTPHRSASVSQPGTAVTPPSTSDRTAEPNVATTGAQPIATMPDTGTSNGAGPADTPHGRQSRAAFESAGSSPANASDHVGAASHTTADTDSVRPTAIHRPNAYGDGSLPTAADAIPGQGRDAGVSVPLHSSAVGTGQAAQSGNSITATGTPVTGADVHRHPVEPVALAGKHQDAADDVVVGPALSPATHATAGHPPPTDDRSTASTRWGRSARPGDQLGSPARPARQRTTARRPITPDTDRKPGPTPWSTTPHAAPATGPKTTVVAPTRIEPRPQRHEDVTTARPDQATGQHRIRQSAEDTSSVARQVDSGVDSR